MLFRIWTGQLADTARSPETKREAAEGLLTRNYPQAEAAIKAVLEDGSNLRARVAVAEAISRVGLGKDSFIEPLLSMLTGQQAEARAPAARALATYKGSQIARRLVQIALDRQQDRQVRLASLIALQSILEKDAVDGLVRLLDDPDPALQAAAEEALAGLTNVRGMNREEWKKWWARNKTKNREEWLASLTENLAQAKKELEAENERLRAKLAATARWLHAITPPAQQDPMLLAMLKDPVAEIRLVALDLVDRRVSENGPVSPDLRSQIRALLEDPETPVRKAAAEAIAHLGDKQALEPPLARLEVEPASVVVQNLIHALGQLRESQAVPAVVSRIASADEAVATSAAMALSRIASAQDLDAERLDEAARSLLTVYRRYDRSKNAVTVREALLTAMGTLADERFVPVIKESLKDPQARVRRAAVLALTAFGKAELAEVIEPHAADADHGVRQASIAALGDLDATRYLRVILRRTDPDTEAQAAVRQQAWDVAMRVCSKADADVLAEALGELGDRDDAPALKIQIRQLQVEKLRQQRSDQLPAAQLALAEDLLASKRAAEAATHLTAAYQAYADRNDPLADQIWLRWVAALLEANNPAVVDTIVQQNQPALLAQAIEQVLERTDALQQQKDWQSLADLVAQTLEKLAKNLDPDSQTLLQTRLAEARKHQVAVDTERIGKLVRQIESADEAARNAAQAEIIDLGQRAVLPLLSLLRTNLAGENPSAATEQVIISLLSQLAPKLEGYDQAMSRNERVALVEDWIKKY